MDGDAVPDRHPVPDDRAGEQDRRLQVLLAWRTRMIIRGWPVPGVADVRRIAIADDPMPPGVAVGAVAPWIRTLSHLLVQMRQGAPRPVEQMPDELTRPPDPGPLGVGAATTPNPTPAAARPAPEEPAMADADRPASTNGSAADGAGSDTERIVRDLRAWRAANLAEHPELRDLRDAHLRTIARTGSRTEADVRSRVTRGVGVHASVIAGIVRRHLADAAEATTADPGPAPAAPESPGAPSDTEVPAAPAAPADAALDDLPLAPGDHTRDVAATKIRQDIVPGATTLRWPESDSTAQVVLYRVVSADDDYRPSRPQDADPAVVTTGTSWTDERPFTTPIRYVQVWVHAGATREAAAAAAPELHAETTVIARVHGPQVVVNGTSVVGRWRLPDGVDSVRVLRVPRRKAGGASPADVEWRVNDDANLKGFVDTRAAAAVDYVYLVYVKVVDLAGQELYSEADRFPVRVPAEIAQVTDLEVRLRREDGRRPVLDLCWTPPPHCDVRIHLSADPPAAGSAERPVPVGELERMRLPENTLLPHPPTEREDGRMEVLGVEWPRGSAFVWATAVAQIGDEVWVGRPHLEISLPPVDGVAIVERTHRQILVFDWPEGADNVLAFVGFPRQDLANVMRSGQEPEQIPRDRYERQGGLHFRHRLPVHCTVHVMAQAFVDQRSRFGPVAEVAYVGQHRLWYTLAAQGTGRGHQASVLTLQIGAEDDRRTEVPGFTLVHHPERLPLHWQDGEALDVLPAGSTQARGGRFFRPEALWRDPGQAAWNVPVAGRTGWVRLFVHPEPNQRVSFALIDPAVVSLYLPPPPPGGRP